jgi:hypothetical protein
MTPRLALLRQGLAGRLYTALAFEYKMNAFDRQNEMHSNGAIRGGAGVNPG